MGPTYRFPPPKVSKPQNMTPKSLQGLCFQVLQNVTRRSLFFLLEISCCGRRHFLIFFIWPVPQISKNNVTSHLKWYCETSHDFLCTKIQENIGTLLCDFRNLSSESFFHLQTAREWVKGLCLGRPWPHPFWTITKNVIANCFFFLYKLQLQKKCN